MPESKMLINRTKTTTTKSSNAQVSQGAALWDDSCKKSIFQIMSFENLMKQFCQELFQQEENKK